MFFSIDIDFFGLASKNEVYLIEFNLIEEDGLNMEKIKDKWTNRK